MKNKLKMNLQLFAQAKTSLIVGMKEDAQDEMLLLDNSKSTFLKHYGISSQAVSNTKYEWFEDELISNKTTLAGSLTDSATTVVVADLEPFGTNSIIKVDEEMMLVTAINTGTKTLTMTRGYNSTTAAAHSNGAEVLVMFDNIQEGADFKDARYKKRTKGENYTQIFQETIKISGSAQSVAQYGIDNLYETEKMKRQAEMMTQLENAVINGVPYSNGDTRYMGGVKNFIKSNVIDAGAADITLDMINDALFEISKVGGMKGATNHVIIVHPKVKRKIVNLLKDNVRIERTDKTTGFTYDYIATDYGDLAMDTSNDLSVDELIITDTNRARVAPLNDRTFSHEYAGKKGDYIEGSVLGEYTLIFNEEKAHARIINIKK